MASSSITDLASFFPAIDSAAAQIRILELHPEESDSDADVHLSYQIISLNRPHLPYEALSYAWRSGQGNESHSQPIYVDGRPIEVSQSLFEAVKQLRGVSEKRRLWIDAICINQADDHEKTSQVNLMRSIYTQCRQCIVWLGSLDPAQHPLEDAQIAVDTIAWIADENDTPPWHSDSGNLGRAALAVKTLMNVSWWHRIWTVQEAILPPRATLHWGPAQLPWDLIHRAAERLLDEINPKPDSILWELNKNGALDDLTAALLGLKYSRTEYPLHLFWRWRFRDATDPRDKIYGLMGIRENLSLQSVPSCDYTIDVATLYSRVTADLIRIACDLEPLIGRRGEEAAIEGLPSWATDWSRPGGCYWVDQARWVQSGYTADRGMYGVGDGLRITDDERTLILSGVFIDKIAAVEQFDGHLSGGSAPALLLSGGEKWGKLFETFFGLQSPSSSYQSDGRWMRDFLGVIMGKLDPENPDEGDPADSWAHDILRSQAIFVTDSGRVGVGPTRVQPGYELWILGGCRFPVILDLWKDPYSRLSTEGRNDFKFVAECFVYGIMKGEAVLGKEQSDIRLH